MASKKRSNKPTGSRSHDDGGLPLTGPDERRPKEDGGHARKTYSLDEPTRNYLARTSEKSEVVEDGIFLYSLLKDELEALKGIKPEREGRRRRKVAESKIKRI